VATGPVESVVGMSSITAQNAEKQTCPQGHPYDEENTYFDSRGSRHCRTCRREHQRAFRQRAKGRRLPDLPGVEVVNAKGERKRFIA
jgi:hypothetical protein